MQKAPTEAQIHVMQRSVEQLLTAHYRHEGRLVIAFSGGADSCVLLDLVSQFKAIKAKQGVSVSCLAIYVHHGLSAHADEWAAHCVAFAGQRDIPCLVEKITLDLNAGKGVEEAARSARYRVFERHISANDLLLTGHHQHDQLETFLLALKRGSGPKGLSAMGQHRAFAAGGLLRPLLGVEQQIILDYAKRHQLTWVDDESNADERFDRNFIRHQLSPILTARWPSILSSVSKSAALCAKQETLLNELLTPIYQDVRRLDGSLSIAALRAQSQLAREQLFRRWFAEHGLLMPTQVQLSALWQEVALAKDDANPKLCLQQYQVRRFNEALYLLTDSPEMTDWRKPLELSSTLRLPAQLGHLSLVSCSAFDVERLTKPVRYQARLALSAEQLNQLSVHFDPKGLVAHPFGRGRRRKLKKLFQEYGVPPWLRTQTPLLMCGDQLVCAVGLFVDCDFVGDDCLLVWHGP